MSDESSVFKYSLGGTETVILVNLSGRLNPSSIPELDNLKAAIQGRGQVHSVILNFSQIEMVSVDTVPSLTLMLKAFREMPSEVRICSLRSDIKDKLNRVGILRSSELADSPKDAIQSLSTVKSNAA